eukprot:scaffold1353_cov363-Pavlova_lutheri.AAC.10
MDSAGIDQSKPSLHDLVMWARGNRTPLPRKERAERSGRSKHKVPRLSKGKACTGQELDSFARLEVVEDAKVRKNRKRQICNHLNAKQARERYKARLEELQQSNQVLTEVNKVLRQVVKKLQKKVFAGKPVSLDESHLLHPSE